MELKIKLTSGAARVPTYGSDGAACFDLYASHGGEVGAYGSAVVDTGLAVEVPEGFAMLIYSRSGHGFKHGVSLVNAVGVIDSDFRGNVKVGLRNNSALRFDYKAGERIAQAMLVPVQRTRFVLCTELSDTARGAGGFGSTGQ